MGGRLLTYRDKAGWQVELGGMRIPETHQIVMYYMKNLFQLKLEEFISSHPETYYYFNGIRRKHREYYKNPDSLEFDTLPEEKGKTAVELLENAFEPYVSEVLSKGWNYFNNAYDNMSLYAFFVQKTNLSQGAINMIGNLLNYDNCWHFSFVANFISFYCHEYSRFFTISNGMSSLPEAFLEALDENTVFLNSRLVTVAQDTHQVTATYSKNNSSSASLAADYLIMTTSPSVLTIVKFKPQLSQVRKNLLRDIFFDHCTKIALAFSSRFWEDEGIQGGRTITDLPTRTFYYQNGGANFTGGVVLSYNWAHDSQLLSGLNDAECLGISLDNLAKIHGQHIRELYIGGIVKHWQLDRNSLGAYAWPLPLQRAKILKAFHQNDGLIWFAGDYTDIPHCWVETAVKSGLRAAIKLNQFISHEDLYKSKTEL